MRTKRNRPTKAIRTFQGIAVNVERPIGTVVDWMAADGSAGQTTYVADYGYLPGKKSIDGDSLDVFVGPNEDATEAFVFVQRKNGKIEQPKIMLGWLSVDEARNAFDLMRWPGAYGGGARLSVDSLKTQLKTWNGFLEIAELIDDEDLEPESEPFVTLDELRAIAAREEVDVAERADVSNFPAKGDDKKVSLRNSQWSVFDVSYMEDIKKNHSDVWKLGGNIEGNAQFRRLVPIAKRGGYPTTDTEEYAIRLREAWGARHFENKLAAGVVALGKWLVIGKIGDAKMKKVMNAEKADSKDMDNAKTGFSHLVRGIAAAALASGTLAPEVRDAVLQFTRDAGTEPTAAETRPDGLHVRTIHVREVREDAREVDFIASTEAVDSYGEIVKQNWRLERFMRNPVILFAHDSHSLPIGHAPKCVVENGALRITVKFSTAKANPFAELCFQSVLEKALRGGSVGFKPHTVRYEKLDDVDRCILDDNELYEFSVCPLPSNPDGLAQLERRMAKSLGQTHEALLKSLSAVPAKPVDVPKQKEGRVAIKKTIGDAEVTVLRTRGMCKFTCDCGGEMEIEMPMLAKMDEEAKTLAGKLSDMEKVAELARVEKRKTEIGVELSALVTEGKLLADDVDDLVELAIEKPEKYTAKFAKIKERAPLNAPDLTKRVPLGGEPSPQRGVAGAQPNPDTVLISLGADMQHAAIPMTVSDPDAVLLSL